MRVYFHDTRSRYDYSQAYLLSCKQLKMRAVTEQSPDNRRVSSRVSLKNEQNFRAHLIIGKFNTLYQSLYNHNNYERYNDSEYYKLFDHRNRSFRGFTIKGLNHPAQI